MHLLFPEKSHDDIEQLAHAACNQERRSQIEFLLHVEEIKRRKIYLFRGYGSINAYLIGEFGLSKDQAYQRSQVSWIITEFPEFREMLDSGDTHLAQLSIVAPRITEANCETFIARMPGLSKRETQQLIQQVTDDGKLLPPKELTQISLTVNEDIHGKWQRAIDLARSGHGSLDQAEALNQILETYLGRCDPERKAQRHAEKQKKKEDAKLEDESTDLSARNDEIESAASARNDEKNRKRALPQATRHRVYLRDGGRCTYVDGSGQRCEETRFLEIDHLRPFSRGGSHEMSNLHLLCGNHHRLKSYIESRSG